MPLPHPFPSSLSFHTSPPSTCDLPSLRKSSCRSTIFITSHYTQLRHLPTEQGGEEEPTWRKPRMSRKITQHNQVIKEEEDYDPQALRRTIVGAGVGEEGRTPSRKDQAVTVEAASCGRERLKRHRIEIAGRVWIPDTWGQEELLKDWIDCSAFDSSLFQAGISSARKALVEECRSANSGGFAIGNYQC